ncbi:MAG: hypothetical protein Q8936_21615 [Bacillota bacterium]|nr:hypothetical protein [Bacillota bacterium]
MKVKVTRLTDEEMENREYRQVMEIKINGKTKFLVRDDEPEDSNLSRSFNDVWNIPELMELAWKAGKNGEDLLIEYAESEDI